MGKSRHKKKNAGSRPDQWGTSGMTMREYYAGCALTGLLANGEHLQMGEAESDKDLADGYAETAFVCADAMFEPAPEVEDE